MKKQINEMFEGALVIGLAAFFAAALISAGQPQQAQSSQMAQAGHATQHA